MNKRKSLAVLLSSILILSLLTGCGASYNNAATDSYYSPTAGITMNSSDSKNSIFDYGVKQESSVEMGMGDVYYDSPMAPKPEEVPELEQEFVERKIVYTANLEMETKDIETALNQIKTTLDEYGGYIESENRNNWSSYETLYTRRNARMQLRIPSEHFDSFLNGLSNENLIINSMHKDSEDYSEYYYDKESRINSLRIQETRLLELLANADDVSIMLQIENNLTDVRYQIESLTKELKTIDARVDYSTISLNIYEVSRYTAPVTEPLTFWEEIEERFGESIDNFIEFLKELLFVLIAVFPYIILLIVILVILKPLFKKRKSKREAKKIAKLEKKLQKQQKNQENIDNQNK